MSNTIKAHSKRKLLALINRNRKLEEEALINRNRKLEEEPRMFGFAPIMEKDRSHSGMVPIFISDVHDGIIIGRDVVQKLQFDYDILLVRKR